MRIDEIKAQYEKDCRFDPTQLDVESLRSPELFSKYSRIFHDERLVLQRKKMEHATLRRLKWEYYSGRLDPAVEKAKGWVPFHLKVIRQDMDIYMDADQDLQAIAAGIVLQEEKIRVLEGIIKSIFSRQWDIKNAIEWKKFISGTS